MVRSPTEKRMGPTTYLTATYRFEGGFRLRAYWYRTLPTSGRDTDVVMLGLGWAL